MYKSFLLVLLLAFLPGCAAQGYCSCAAPTLGIATDAAYTVMDVDAHSPAAAVDIQVGDKLLELRPAKPEPGFSMEAVPFSDKEGIRKLLDYKVPSPLPTACCSGLRLPLILRVERAGEIVEIAVRSDNAPRQPTAVAQEVSPINTSTPIPTVTPMPSDWLYF